MGDGLPAPGESLGGWVLERELGRGAMGAVYIGRNAAGARRAVKVPLFLGNESAALRERFTREAQALAKIRPHEGVVGVHAQGEERGLAYCVLELVEGKGLDALAEASPLTVGRILELAERIARALDHIHQAGVIHRDLKPANVMVRDRDGSPVITDFGLARDESLARLTASGTLLGTPAYMAPEQLDGGKMSERASDIWALGVIVYELLSGGARPFAGESFAEMATKIMLEAPPPLSKLRADVTPGIERIVLKALAKEARDRYARAADMADDLARARRGEAVEAKLVGRGELARRWLASHRRLVAGAALGTALLVAASVLALVLHRRYVARRDAAGALDTAARALDSETGPVALGTCAVSTTTLAVSRSRVLVEACDRLERAAAEAERCGLSSATTEAANARKLKPLVTVIHARALAHGDAREVSQARELLAAATEPTDDPDVQDGRSLARAEVALALGEPAAALEVLLSLVRRYKERMEARPRRTAVSLAARACGALGSGFDAQRAKATEVLESAGDAKVDAVERFLEGVAAAGASPGAIDFILTFLGRPGAGAVATSARPPASLAPTFRDLVLPEAEKGRFERAMLALSLAARADPRSASPQALRTQIQSRVGMSSDPETRLAFHLAVLKAGVYPENVEVLATDPDLCRRLTKLLRDDRTAWVPKFQLVEWLVPEQRREDYQRAKLPDLASFVANRGALRARTEPARTIEAAAVLAGEVAADESVPLAPRSRAAFVAGLHWRGLARFDVALEHAQNALALGLDEPDIGHELVAALHVELWRAARPDGGRFLAPALSASRRAVEACEDRIRRTRAVELGEEEALARPGLPPLRPAPSDRRAGIRLNRRLNHARVLLAARRVQDLEALADEAREIVAEAHEDPEDHARGIRLVALLAAGRRDEAAALLGTWSDEGSRQRCLERVAQLFEECGLADDRAWIDARSGRPSTK